jgi:gliding motility-associated-like protein
VNKLTNKEEVFKHKLQGFEAPVNDALWAGIQSGLAASSVGGVAGMSKISAILLKSFAVAVFVGASTFGIYKMLSHNKSPLPKKSVQKILVNKNEELFTSTKETQNKDVAVKTFVSKKNNPPKTLKFSEKPSSSKTQKLAVLTGAEMKSAHSLNKIVKDPNTENTPNDGFVQQSDNNKKDNTIKNVVTQSANDVNKPLNVLADNSKKKAEKLADLDSTVAVFTHSNTSFMDKLPNVITPNGDGRNDVLLITTPELQQYALTVYNENGAVIFRTNDPAISWRGLDFNGQEVKAGIYIYQISAIGADGKDFGSKIQQITVIR